MVFWEVVEENLFLVVFIDKSKIRYTIPVEFLNMTASASVKDWEDIRVQEEIQADIHVYELNISIHTLNVLIDKNDQLQRVHTM